MTITLYAHPLSSYCQKVLIALYELDLAFELKLLDHANPEVFAELVRIWPFGKFPVLVDEGRPVPEASLIIEHLDVHHGVGRFLPSDLDTCMEARLMDRVFDNYVSTPQQKTVTDLIREPGQRDPHGVGEAHALLDKSYAWLERRLEGRTWAAGDVFSLADCGAAPMLFYADWAHPIPPDCPNLSDYLKRLRRRPAVARAFAGARPYLHLVPGGVPAHVKL